MSYFVIRSSQDKKILGHYPQVKDIKQNCNVWDDPKFVENVQFQKVDFEPITANAILYDSSNITDLIDVVGMGFTKKLLISGKLKEIIEEFRQTGLQFFRAPIIFKGQLLRDYWLLNMYEINMGVIDVEKSKFVVRKRKPEGGTYIEKVNITSINDFYSTLNNKDFKQFYIEDIKLKKNINFDFFYLDNVEGGVKYIVSEKLKNHIERENCTGIEFMPAEMRLAEWLQGGEREKIYGKI